MGFGTPEWPDRDRDVFVARREKPQLDLTRDFPPLCGKEVSERGSAKKGGSIGDIARSLCESDNKRSRGGTELCEEVQGDDVVVIRGLPPTCEEEVLHGLLSPYGRVLHCQRTSASSGPSATFVVRYAIAPWFVVKRETGHLKVT